MSCRAASRARLGAFAPRFAELSEELGSQRARFSTRATAASRIRSSRSSSRSFVETGQDEIRDAYPEAYGGDRETFDLALRIGGIGHVFEWAWFRDALPPGELPSYDDWFVGWLDQAVRQTGE